MTIFGEQGDSGERQLKESKNRNKFEQNQVRAFCFRIKKLIFTTFFQEDVFEIKAVSLGKLRKIKIRHDDAGVSFFESK